MNKITKMLGARKLICAAALAAAAVATPSIASARDRDHWDRGDRYRHDGRGDDVRVNIRIGEPAPAPVVERVWVEPVYRTVTDRVWVEPEYRTVCDRVWHEAVTQDVCDRVWVEPIYESRQHVVSDRHGRRVEIERFVVQPGHWEDRHRTVVVTDGYWENVERRELVREGGWQTVERQEVVCAGHFEDRPVRVVEDRPSFGFGFEIRGR